MITLGIDLAADPANTAACRITWEHGRAAAEKPCTPLTDDAIRALVADADWTGIDAPFSWPIEFRRALAQHGESGGWPADYRETKFQLRATDIYVSRHARRPLSVSTDRIGVTAMRCARLLQEIGDERGKRLSLTGEDRIVEVYPAAALSAWGAKAAGFDPQGYKTGADAGEKRARLVDSFWAASRAWLDWPDEARAECVRSDHCLDAFISALVTRAAQLKRTHKPQTVEQREAAAIEGWIHVPEPGTLSRLHD
jgi:predicted nuclease with RNAse H fold